MKSDDVPQQASHAPGTALLALRLPAAESNELIHEHHSASQLASRLQAMPNPSPARPGLAQGFGVLWINRQNAAAAEPSLQQLRAVGRKGLKHDMHCHVPPAS